MASKKGGAKYFILLGLLAVAVYWAYSTFFKQVKSINGTYYLYVKPNQNFDDIVKVLMEDKIIEDAYTFDIVAKGIGIPEKVKPGKYRITSQMNLKNILAMLRSGRDEKVRLSLNQQIENLDFFIEYTADKLSLSEEDLEEALINGEVLNQVGLTPESAFAVLVPGTLDVNWAIEADSLVKILVKRYDKVWTSARKKLAQQINLSPLKCIILASIVQSESHIQSEQEKIAGVYLNRLKRNMPLQADPTLRFANQINDVQRFLNTDKKVDSPYNTYKYKGLPPGPICLVYPQALEATLNYKRHRFMYFCARPQLNGYSDFSESYSQHQKFAETYQKSLDKRGISR